MTAGKHLDPDFLSFGARNQTRTCNRGHAVVPAGFNGCYFQKEPWKSGHAKNFPIFCHRILYIASEGAKDSISSTNLPSDILFTMLRLPSQQVLKAPIRGLFRNPLRNFPRALPSNPPYGSLQVRHSHDVPFSGPPSYATLARRFSSSPSPISFFATKDANEAIERGEFVDIHDIGGIDPKDYDVLLTDIDHNTLDTEISRLAGIKYLTEATKEDTDIMARKVHGFFYGQKFRMIFPCVLGHKGKGRWVYFIMDTGAPVTYISTQASFH